MSRTQVALTPSWGRRIVGMEGLRALAAVTVLIGHTKVHLAPGVDWGVFAVPAALGLKGLVLFFALSGFLLFRPFATALLTGGAAPDLRRYAVNRALRIFPVYIVIVLLVSLVLGLAYTSPQGATQAESGDMVGYMTDPWLVLINTTMLQTFFPFSMKTGLGVAWSLTVELVFYVVMPLLALLALRVQRRRSRDGMPAGRAFAFALAPVAAILAIGIVGKAVKWALFRDIPPEQHFLAEWGGNWVAVFSRSFLANADLFAFGMVAAVVVAAFETGRLSHDLAFRFRAGALVVAVGATLATRVVPDSLEQTAFAAAYGALILFVAMPARDARPGLLARFLALPPLEYMGRVSYSLYLWHIPVIWLVVRLGIAFPRTPAGLLANVVLVLVISVAFSTVTYYLVERPALRAKKRTDTRARAGDGRLLGAGDER